ncbi:MAG: metallophosphoesterase [Clostridia bacterium]|nr:metallophosphoesterase [Clostridia bacterium]
MKNKILRRVALFVASCCVFLTACQGNTHTHDFSQKNTQSQYLKTEATCVSPAFYYYSCPCGETGEEIFFDGRRLTHDFSAEVAADEYAIEPGNCLTGGLYYKSCVYCGKKGYDFTTFHSGPTDKHDYTQEVPDGEFIKTEATSESVAVYFKSCICGKKGEDTFSFGEPLRTYTDEEKALHTPTSLTVTLYDSENAVYGFTYNTQSQPLRPVIQISEGSSLTEDCKEYPAKVEKASSYTTNGEEMTYYIVKTTVPLSEAGTYTYRAYDKYVDFGTEEVTIDIKDVTADAFSFAHVSDSQNVPSSGVEFGRVLANVVGKNDFIVHTGDVVENSKYESEWSDMLHGNFSYLSKIPMMAISGNHETTYLNGSYETYKHFHNKIPQQKSTQLGYFYSFVYGNAKFIMLNTNDLTDDQLLPEQYDWLVGELENNTSTWTIVTMHNPMYSVGKWGSDPERNQICLALRQQLSGLFARYGVDLVLQGHDHTVSRTHPIDEEGRITQETWQTVNGIEYSVDPSGVIYVMNGPAGGTENKPFTTYDNSYYVYAKESYESSWADIQIDGNALTVTVQYVTASGVRTYEQWGIQKSDVK